jgi:hypothetical protein
VAGVEKRKRAGLQGIRQCQTPPNKGLELTAYSLRCALASGSGSGLAFGHKTLAMVKWYAHLSEAPTHSVVERRNWAVFGEP